MSHKRVLEKGDTFNVLAMLKIWGICVETVTSLDPSECYSITSTDFFRSDSICKYIKIKSYKKFRIFFFK